MAKQMAYCERSEIKMLLLSQKAGRHNRLPLHNVHPPQTPHPTLSKKKAPT
ncbi:MAG: hypothetical protein FWB93_04000 [Oscillospiraceae bacterium]|nr:hypothetical protein [Oscillospiraceae bacterium]